MKSEVQQLNPTKIVEDFPVTGIVEGWYFRLEEVPPGAWRADGTDLFGRRASYNSSDPVEALSKCKEYAVSITD
jgi:hypothetical protein